MSDETKRPIWETLPDKTSSFGFKLCVLPECSRPMISRRLCSGHYQSARRGTLDPETGVSIAEKVKANDLTKEQGYAPSFKGYDKYVFLAQPGEIMDVENHTRFSVYTAMCMWGSRIKLDIKNNKIKHYVGEIWNPVPNADSGEYYNVYRPLQSLKQTEYELLHQNTDELLFNLAGEDVEWFKDWLAYKIQNPWVCHGAVIVHGVPGAGKGTLEAVLKAIFDPYFSSIDSLALASSFNGWAAKRFFIVADEVNTMVMRDREMVKKQLKKYTAPNILLINQKNVATYNQKNYASWLIYSNDETVVDIEEGDRRFSVMKASLAISYALGAEIANNAEFYGQNLVNNLTNRDISKFKVGTPLDNQARRTMMAKCRMLRVVK